MCAPQAPGLTEEADRVLGVKCACTAERTHAADPTHLDRKSAYPVSEQAEAVDHEIHHHGVIGILRATKAGFNDCKPGLHEHDQKSSDQCPNEVDRDSVLTNLV